MTKDCLVYAKAQITQEEKPMKNLLATLLISSFTLAGCVVVPETPSAKIVIKSSGGPVHCPPGQAKKGHC